MTSLFIEIQYTYVVLKTDMLPGIVPRQYAISTMRDYSHNNLSRRVDPRSLRVWVSKATKQKPPATSSCVREREYSHMHVLKSTKT